MSEHLGVVGKFYILIVEALKLFVRVELHYKDEGGIRVEALILKTDRKGRDRVWDPRCYSGVLATQSPHPNEGKRQWRD